MENKLKNIYITKFGRQSRQTHTNYNFNNTRSNRHNQLDQLRCGNDIKVENMNEHNEQNDVERERQNLEQMRARLEAERQEIEAQRIQQQQAAAALAQQQQQHQQAVALAQQQHQQALAALKQQQRQGNNVAQQPRHGQPLELNASADLRALLGALNLGNNDLKAPKFSNENESNPREFIESLEKYFNVKNIPNNQKMQVVEAALQGKAKIWIDLQNNLQNYDAFKVRFIEAFYSVPVMCKVKTNWSNRKYREGSLLLYFFLKQNSLDILIHPCKCMK